MLARRILVRGVAAAVANDELVAGVDLDGGLWTEDGQRCGGLLGNGVALAGVSTTVPWPRALVCLLTQLLVATLAGK